MVEHESNDAWPGKLAELSEYGLYSVVGHDA